MDSHFEGSLTAHHGTGIKFTKGGRLGGRSWVTIEMLSDATLLEIFDIYLDKDPEYWYTLVHVCQNWRKIVFGAARRLDLQLRCTAGTRVREMPDIWPPLPIVVESDGHEKWGVDNIVAALEHNNDHVIGIYLWPLSDAFSISEMEEILAAMQQPFPALRNLELESAPVDFASFLGGSAPCLQELCLNLIAFPGLPKLLLSATHLVSLTLVKIHQSGYISPEEMVSGLSVLTSLNFLDIRFESRQSRPDPLHPSPQTRTPLPALADLRFKGVLEYLEDLVARIDAPLLYFLKIILFHEQIFDTPHLNQFISRTSNFVPFGARDVAYLDFISPEISPGVCIKLPISNREEQSVALELGILSKEPDWQLSSLAQLCSSSFPQSVLHLVKRLYITGEFSRPHWQDDIEISQWLELLHPFTAVKDLYISQDFAPSVALVLQELKGERGTEVLPALQTLLFEEPLPSGPVLEIIGEFVAARGLVGHTIAVSRWRLVWRARCGSGKKLTDEGRSWVTVDMLPDVALLEIFDFFLDEDSENWLTLVHVCQNWRNVVFGSTRRLNLQLRCTAGTPARHMLDIWPPLPIVVESDGHEKWGVDNIVAALEHKDRIIGIDLWPFGYTFSSSEMEEILAVMQQPFPVLRDLRLRVEADETAPVDFASFLGGFVPCLQELALNSITFPGLPKLLLSATHLVRLDLSDIPDSGYISPEAMVACLSVSTRLDQLNIHFGSYRSRPDRRRPPPQTRTLLPVLSTVDFDGACEYLDDLVARIDAPLLKYLRITFFREQVFDTPHLNQFITRTPNFRARDEARVHFKEWGVWVGLPQLFGGRLGGMLKLGISTIQPDWQLSGLAQLCSSSLSQDVLPMVERLYIRGNFSRLHWQDDIEINQWLELLHPFTAVKDLYISEDFAPSVALVLQELDGERVTEVLPALKALFLEEPLPSGPIPEIIGEFVDARELVGRRISVSRGRILEVMS